MPSESKSQQHLFGMVRAYQEGEMKKAPAKIKQVAAHISPSDAHDFASTKTKGLPNKVKKAMDFSGEMHKPIGYNQYGKMVTPNELGYKLSHQDEAEDKQLIKNMVKPNSLKKEAFELGFVKAALARGFNP